MSIEIIFVFAIIVGALVLFVLDVLPVDLTAILVMVSLMVTGVLSPAEAISGFSNEATITILALLIISQGLKNTGAVEELGNVVLRISGSQTWVTLLIVMGISAVTSGFINTTAVVAVFIPIMFQISKSTGIHSALLLIPLSFASMIGGSSTMIGTSTNLLIGSLAVENGLPEFDIFKPTLVGVILLALLMIYMATVGKWLLKRKEGDIEVFERKVDPKQYLTEVLLSEHSEYIGKELGDVDPLNGSDISLLAIQRKGNKITNPSEKLIIEKGDAFIIRTDVKNIVNFNANDNLRISTNHIAEDRGVMKNKRERELFEVLVASNSNLLDQRIENVDFNSYYDAWPLAVKKKKEASPELLLTHKISYGDILLMSGDSHKDDERSRNAWIMVQRFSPEVLRKHLPRRDRMWLSIVIIALVIGLAVTGVLPILVSAWAGVAAMFLSGCLTLKRAYDNVEWKVIFLLAGIIPLGLAVQVTGADELIADGLLTLTGNASIHLIVALFFFITVLLTGIVSNQATAVLLVPIAVNLALTMHMPPEPLVMTILFGASCSFLTPVGYQTNAMIYGPGNYKFLDFVKVGGPITLVFGVIVTFLVPYFYG